MQAQELIALPTPELEKRLDDAHRELFNLRFQRAVGQLTNMARLGQVRKEIARLKTAIREHELGIARGEQ